MPRQVIEKFELSHLSILDESGHLDKALDPGLSAPDLRRLYRAMVRSRETDQRMLKLQRQGRIGTFPLSTGQEAAACGVGLAMSDQDWFVGTYREPGLRFMRGESALQILLVYAGYEEGNVPPPNTARNLPISVIVGAQALHATGVAYALKYRREPRAAVVAYLGDGATSQGDVHEALNFAAVWNVPVVFICQNNQWAISVPRQVQTRSKTLAQKAIAYDIPSLQVDGNDALAMYVAAREALDRAYAGEGPTFIEAVTYRLLMHTTADDPKKYRSDDEVKAWEKRDPLPRFQTYLRRKGLWDDEQEAAMLGSVKAEIETAVQALEAPTERRPDLAFDHVFGTSHAVIEEQRAQFLAELDREHGHD